MICYDCGMNLERTIATQKTDQTLFNQGLVEIAEVLKATGVTYAGVGGLALAALLDDTLTARRLNGTRRDIDLIALGP